MLDSKEFKSVSKHISILGIFFMLMVLSFYWLRETCNTEGYDNRSDLDFAEAKRGKRMNDDVKERDVSSSIWEDPSDNVTSNDRIKSYLNAMEDKFKDKMNVFDKEVEKIQTMISGDLPNYN